MTFLITNLDFGSNSLVSGFSVVCGVQSQSRGLVNSFKASSHHAPNFWLNAIQIEIGDKGLQLSVRLWNLDNRASLHFHIMRSTVLIWDLNSALEPLKDSGVKENETIFSFTSDRIHKLQCKVALLARPRVVINFGPRFSRSLIFQRNLRQLAV